MHLTAWLGGRHRSQRKSNRSKVALNRERSLRRDSGGRAAKRMDGADARAAAGWEPAVHAKSET